MSTETFSSQSIFTDGLEAPHFQFTTLPHQEHLFLAFSETASITFQKLTHPTLPGFVAFRFDCEPHQLDPLIERYRATPGYYFGLCNFDPNSD